LKVVLLRTINNALNPDLRIKTMDKRSREGFHQMIPTGDVMGSLLNITFGNLVEIAIL